jgi:hypothetical protein
MLWIVQQEQQIHISQQIKSYPEKKGNPIAHDFDLSLYSWGQRCSDSREKVNDC